MSNQLGSYLAVIKVVGIGGGGSNAVTRMVEASAGQMSVLQLPYNLFETGALLERSTPVGTALDGPPSGNFIAIGDVDGDGRNDIVVNDGPGVLLQQAAAPGSFHPRAPLCAAAP